MCGAVATYEYSTCGRSVPEPVTDYGFSLPDNVWEIPGDERPRRAIWTSDLCQFGERFFIRCLLPVPFVHREGRFGWGVWAEVAESDFRRYVSLYDDDASGEPAVRGRMANALAPYPESKGLPVWVQFQTATQRPTLTLVADSRVRLAVDQREGIDDARHRAVLTAMESASASA
ncbi:MAG: DUF2199 domain-containing protein [Chloroflexota bacterium]